MVETRHLYIVWPLRGLEVYDFGVSALHPLLCHVRDSSVDRCVENTYKRVVGESVLEVVMTTEWHLRDVAARTRSPWGECVG